MRFSTKYASWVALGLLGLAGCKSSGSSAADPNQIAFNDFESMMGWAPNVETLSREQAHSGKYSVKVGPGAVFGLGYSTQLNKVFDHKPHKLRISGWGYMSDTRSAARLGFQVFDLTQNKEVYGNGIDYTEAVKTPGKWVEIDKVITLPATVTGEQQMRVFLYGAGASTPAYIDDMRISDVPE